jgi:hypothetical protein
VATVSLAESLALSITGRSAALATFSSVNSPRSPEVSGDDAVQTFERELLIESPNFGGRSHS